VNTAIIFAILSGQPAFVEYSGNLSLPFDPHFATEVTFEKAEKKIKRGSPVLFAPPKGPVVRATKKEALSLLAKWKAANSKRDFASMKSSLKAATKKARKRKLIAK